MAARINIPSANVNRGTLLEMLLTYDARFMLFLRGSKNATSSACSCSGNLWAPKFVIIINFSSSSMMLHWAEASSKLIAVAVCAAGKHVLHQAMIGAEDS